MWSRSSVAGNKLVIFETLTSIARPAVKVRRGTESVATQQVRLSDCCHKVIAAAKITGIKECLNVSDRLTAFKIGDGRRQQETHGYVRPPLCYFLNFQALIDTWPSL